MAPEKKSVTVDVDEFRRTRDALTTAFVNLSSSVDDAVKAYIKHTNAVLAGDASLNVSYLTQPFNALAPAVKLIQSSSDSIEALPEAPIDGGADDSKAAPKKRKRTYKARDPNAPKRPLTAYFRFLHEQRPVIAVDMAKDPGKHKPGELTQIATERWSKMSHAQKQLYHNAYTDAKKIYDQDLADYKARTNQLTIEGAGDEEIEEQEESVPEVKTAIAVDSDSDDESVASTDEEPSPPPPPPSKAKKLTSPEAVRKPEKTPKSTVKKAQKLADAITSTPMFNSIDSAVASSVKKRASDTADEASPKKKRGRPSKASQQDDELKKDKPKKKKPVGDA